LIADPEDPAQAEAALDLVGPKALDLVGPKLLPLVRALSPMREVPISKYEACWILTGWFSKFRDRSLDW
jgi:hypothetical protein